MLKEYLMEKILYMCLAKHVKSKKILSTFLSGRDYMLT